MSVRIKPILQALLVADKVYTDAGSNKKIVVGIFSRLSVIPPTHTEGVAGPDDHSGKSGLKPITAKSFHPGSPCAYVRLTDVKGVQEFELRYVRRADEKVLIRIKFQIESSSPLESPELGIPLPTLPADRLGEYELELLWNDERLGFFRINVAAHQGEGEQHDQ